VRLLAILRRELRRAADPAKAPAMQAYMKSAMPYHGVSTPALRDVCRQVFAGYDLSDPARWRRDALALWRQARYREERYGAIAPRATGGRHRSRRSRRCPCTRR
jgi:hypothetical protein